MDQKNLYNIFGNESNIIVLRIKEMFDNKFINASYSDSKNAPAQIKDTLRLSFKNVIYYN